MDIISKLENYCQEFLSEDQFIVDIVQKGNGPQSRIIILLDGDQGVTIDQCADLSRKVGRRIEEEDLIDQSFVLEVSSPGVEMPLTLKRQFSKNLGRDLKVEVEEGKVLVGELVEVTEDSIRIKKKQLKKRNKKDSNIADGPTAIKFDEITKATVQISFKH